MSHPVPLTTRPNLWIVAALALAACAPQRNRPGEGPGPAWQPPLPQVIRAPGVPELEGFSEALKVNLTVFMSAQTAVDSQGNLVGPNDLQAQTRQAFHNVLALVRAARGLPTDVVKLTVYVLNYQPDDFRIIQEASRAVFDTTAPPTLSLVGVSALPAPGLLVSVDAVAMLRSEFPDRARMRSF